jgi:TP901 family phage tail tape measure protein
MPKGSSGGNVNIHISETGAAATTAKIRTLNTSMGKTALQMIGLASAAAVGYMAFNKLKDIIGDSITKFREFEYRMAEINTILRETLKSGIESLSVAFGQATSDLAKGMYDILSAAFPATEAMTLLNTATKASIAGLSTVRESVDIFTTVLNTYGMSARQAANVSDILFQSVIRGKFQFRDLESSLGYVVPIAAQAGISFKELMAALSTTTRHGLHLDMTSRGLALAIQGIVNPTEGASEAARKYGIDMSAVGLRTMGLYNWFRELNEATKIYGKTIISELIPNMRSLRVAMVLAGEEGIGGFIDDLNQLDTAAGRTVEALNEIMESDLFKQRQIEQRGEVIQREFGDPLSDIALGFQEAMLRVLYAQKDFFGAEPGAYYKQASQFDEYINEMIDSLEELENPIEQAIADIEDLEQTIESLQTTSFQLEVDIADLNKRLTDTVVAGTKMQYSFEGTLGYEKALIEANKDYADTTHDVKMGLADENYEYDVLSPNVQSAIRYVREFEKQEEDLSNTMTALNYAMRENNLEIMKMQLRGMMRRRGLTRQEEQQIKRLRIENLEMRIDAEESVEHATAAEYRLYLERKEIIDDTIRDAEELRYQLSYNYNQQLDDIDALITSEGDLLDIRKNKWKTTNDEIYEDSVILYNKLLALNLGWPSGGEPPPPAPPPPPPPPSGYEGGVRPIPDIVKWKFKAGKMWQRGTYYVPSTGMYMLHRGEQVRPSKHENKSVSNSMNASININIAEIRNHSDVEDLGSQLALAVKQKLLDTDVSNYRLR